MKQRFEHKVVSQVLGSGVDIQPVLDFHQNEGWELISVVQELKSIGFHLFVTGVQLYFKRPVDAESKSFKTFIPPDDSLGSGG